MNTPQANRKRLQRERESRTSNPKSNGQDRGYWMRLGERTPDGQIQQVRLLRS